MQQRRSGGPLQVRDAAADSGHYNIPPLGSGGNTASFNHKNKEPQSLNIETHGLTNPSHKTRAEELCRPVTAVVANGQFSPIPGLLSSSASISYAFDDG
jgi:hypothetical protein